MRYYITTAIDYVNSAPHLGTAYEKITADVIARYQRGLGKEVYFLMGNDEHSVKVARAAEEKGMSPLEHCDEMEAVFLDVWKRLGVEPDDFIRTSQERHKAAVREIVQRIKDAGHLYQGHYEGHYCEGCEAFKNEGDLEDGQCPDHKHLEIRWLEEKNWFFKLSAFQKPLEDLYAEHPDFLEPERRKNEILSLLDSGLEDISISRQGESWGVPFPFDPDSVVYVWFDALINYVAGAGFPNDAAMQEKWWPADLHVIGKDITRFHCVIWPAMLMAAGLPLPKKVFGHGFVNMGGDKLSKSQLTPEERQAFDPKHLAETYGADTLRYFLCAEAAYGTDFDYTLERLVARANGELGNAYGNLASRTIAMTVKYREGLVGAAPEQSELMDRARDAARVYREAMEQLDLRGAVQAAMSIATDANVHIDRTRPFEMAKDPARADELQGVLAEILNATLIATRLLFPFMPEKTAQLHEELCGRAIDPTSCIAQATEDLIAADFVVARGPVLFPRIELEKDD